METQIPELTAQELLQMAKPTEGGGMELVGSHLKSAVFWPDKILLVTKNGYLAFDLQSKSSRKRSRKKKKKTEAKTEGSGV